jgi:hypothetical protein
VQQLGDGLVARIGTVVGGDDGGGVEHDAHRRELNAPIESFGRFGRVTAPQSVRRMNSAFVTPSSAARLASASSSEGSR